MATMEQIRDGFALVEAACNARLVGRSNVIRGMLTALVAGEHVCLLGPPGTGKSMLAGVFFSALDGARKYEYLMTKFTTPEEIFGPVSLSALKADRFERKTAGYAAEVEGLFLDECFKANSAILNSLLTLLNERFFDNGGQRVASPLVFALGASNELPEDDSLAALWDRFAVRYWLGYVQGQDQFTALLTAQAAGPMPKLDLADVRLAQSAARALPFDKPMLDLFWTLKNALEDQKIRVSDRTWRKALGLVQAAAWLRGGNPQAEDMEVLTDSLWNDPSQAAVVTQTVMRLANPDVEEAQRVLDTCVEAAETFPYDDLKAGVPGVLDSAGRMNREAKAGVAKLAALALKGSTRIAAMHADAAARHMVMSRAMQAASGV